MLTPGLPAHGAGWFGSLSADQQLDRLGRVVIALEQGAWGSRTLATLHTIAMAFKHLLGGSQTLSRFGPIHWGQSSP